MGSIDPGFNPFQRARELERAPAPGSRVAGFELLELLGAGGFAQVYRARDEQGGEVALKLLSRRSPQELERFRREAEATAALDHPHVVRLHGAGEWEAQPYLVTELVTGCRTLDDVLDQAPREAGLELILQAARGLAHAHARGIAHRDVKPQNLLVGADGRVRVADFGIALASGDERLTRTGAMLGTPGYMAPEQALGRVPVTEAPRCDVWALGALLYRFLTGAAPYAQSGVLGVPFTPDERLTPPRELDPTIPKPLERVCLRALTWEPSARQADAAAFVAELERACAAPPPGRALHVVAALALAGLLTAMLTAAVVLVTRPGAPRQPAAPSAADRPPVAAAPTATPSAAASTAAPAPAVLVITPPSVAALPTTLETPRDAWLLLLRVEALLDWGSPQVVLELVERARAESRAPHLDIAQAQALLQLSRHDAAATALRRVYLAAGGSPEGLDDGDLATAVTQAILTAEPVLPLSLLFTVLEPHTHRGQPLDPAPHYARARARRGRIPRLEASWARTLARRGDNGGCDAVLRELTRRDGETPEAALISATAYLEGGRLELALAALEVAGPDLAAADRWRWFDLRAQARFQLGLLDEADADLRRLETAGGPPSWRHAALRARLELARDRPEDALRALDRADACCPGKPALALLRAEALLAAGRTQDATSIYEGFTESDAPTYGHFLTATAERALHHGRPREAAARVREARVVLPLSDRRLWTRLEAVEARLEPEGGR